MENNSSSFSSSSPHSYPRDIPHVLIDYIFGRCSKLTLFELSLVSREWLSTVTSYMVRHGYNQVLNGGSITIIRRRNLIRRDNHLLLNVPDMSPTHFPHLEFPVRLVGSSSGLICLLDRRYRPVVISPGSRRIQVVPFLPGLVTGLGFDRCYAFGWVLDGPRRSSVIVTLSCRSLIHSVQIFNLTTLTWSTRSTTGVTTAIVTRLDCSAFVSGHFMWLGRNGHNRSLILYDGATSDVSSMDLLPSMRELDLRLGTMGEEVAILWPRDGRTSYIWSIDIETRMFTPITVNINFGLRHSMFARRDVSTSAPGVEFLPLSSIGPSSVLYLLRVDDEVSVNLSNNNNNPILRESLTIHSPRPLLALAPLTSLYQAVYFAARFFPT